MCWGVDDPGSDGGGGGPGEGAAADHAEGTSEVERDRADQAGGGNLSEGRFASAEFLRSAMTCSMIAWSRWVDSAVTSGSVLSVNSA